MSDMSKQLGIDQYVLRRICKNFSNELDRRALILIEGNPRVASLLLNMRLLGSFEMSLDMANALVASGLLRLDEEGYHLSEVSENFVDALLKMSNNENPMLH